MRYLSKLVLALLFLLVAPISYAQVQPPVQPGGQPGDQDDAQYDAPPPDQAQAQPQQPATTVARISVLQGNVSTQRGDSGDWNAASINTPVVPGDRVSSGDRSRTEVQLDFANLIRLDGSTVIRITDLSARHIQIELAQGLVSFVSLPTSEADVEIDTPNLAIHPQRDGSYRIEVNPDGETVVTVRRGAAEVGTAEGSTTLNPGQQITVRGDASTAQYRTSAASGRDAFDDWNDSRDRTTRGPQNSQHLSPYYTGGADLDSNGTWQNVPDYGEVWTPNNVPPDWAPYRDGSWVWEPGWGWTWVAAEPWGWAPYHYGRWFVWNGGWSWWPGPVYPYYRPLWAPAYVSFFGFGHGFGVGLGFGSYGWLPLGPADPCFPWWGGFGLSFNFFRFGDHDHFHDGFRDGFHGRGFISPLAGPLHGRTAFSNLHGLETNPRLRAGITSVSAGRFGNGRVVPEGHRFSTEEVRGAQFARGGLPVAPGRGSLSATGRPAAPGTIPSRNLSSQRFVSHGQPNRPQHSFAAESANVRQQIERQHSSAAGGEGRGVGRESPTGGAPRGGDSPRSSFNRQDWANQNRGQSRTPGNSAGQNNGFRSFDANRGPSGSNASTGTARQFAQSPSAGARPQSSFASGGSDPRGGWQRFTPQQSQSGFVGGRGPSGSAQPNPYSQRNQNRQPLELHKSIVQQRAPTGGAARNPYNGGANPYYSPPRSQPSYRAPEPPRGYSAPPHYSAPAAPHYSAPSAPRGNPSGAYRGGGGSRGGGSSPRPSGGGGGSRPSGGGGGSHGGKPHQR